MACWPLVYYCNFTLLCQFNRGLPNTAEAKNGEKAASKDNWSLVPVFWWSRYLSICSDLFIHQTKWVSESFSKDDEKVVHGGFGAVGLCMPSWGVCLYPWQKQKTSLTFAKMNQFIIDKQQNHGASLCSAVILKSSYVDNLLTSYISCIS